MTGHLVDMEQVQGYIKSPIPFEKQEARKPFTKYGVFGPQVLTEGRFVANDKDLTTVCSKYKAYNSPHFGNWADHSLDEFIKNESSCANENSNHTNYYPQYELVERNLFKGIPDFKRYSPRKPMKVEGMTIDNYVIPEKVHASHHLTAKKEATHAPFGLLHGRDKLYEKMHGLPRETKEEHIKRRELEKTYVSSKAFLPNSVVHSPQRNLHSNTAKTQCLNLYHMDKQISFPHMPSIQYSEKISHGRASPSAFASTGLTLGSN